MTDLQRRFAEEYVVDYHITNAGKRAGIQGDNVNITAWQMLQIPEVQEYVEQLQEQAANRSAISKDVWIAEWAKLGFSNIQDYIDDNLNAKTLSEVKNPQAIKAIKKSVTEFEGGSKETVEFVLHDKVAGLLNIGKHFGWYSADNDQLKPINNINFRPVIQTNSPPLSDTEK